MIEIPLNTYLFVVPNPEDIEKLDAAMKKGTLGYDKLGLNTYLGFFEGAAKSNYQLLKDQCGISGSVQWIELSHVEETV